MPRRRSVALRAGVAMIGPISAFVASTASAAPQPAARVTTRSFSEPFVPNEVLAANGSIWLAAQGPNDQGTGCRIGRLNPTTMAVATYPLVACGFNASAGEGNIFLETTTADTATQTYAIHVERFSISTDVATVLPVVSASVFLGSAIAHTQLQFADGSLWLYAAIESDSGRVQTRILQLSPETGAVEHTYPSVPEIGGIEPFVVAGSHGYVWFSGGPGSAPNLLHIDARTGAARSVQFPIANTSIFDVASKGDELYVMYLTAAQGSRAGASIHVARLNASGRMAARSPHEPLGTWLVADGGGLFSVGPSATCSAPVHVWRVDPATLRTNQIASLGLTGTATPCDNNVLSDGVAGADRSLFYLFEGDGEAFLYRVSTP